MFNLLPKEEIFFDLFERSAANVHKGVAKLLDLMENYRDVPARAQEIKDIEHEGDRLTHEMIERVNRTFITPLEREDIHELACRLDDILDLVDTAVNRMMLYKFKEPTGDAVALARCLEKATGIICDAVPKLRQLDNRRNVEALLKCCVDVHTQENEGDRIEQHALASLFENGHDPIFVIKWKDIYQDLEAATDRCEDVANVIEAIVLKHG
jgi:predicted phosphate transport protein (TIGR00153 family)